MYPKTLENTINMNMLLLLLDYLEENKMNPEILREALEKYLTVVNQYLKTEDIEKQDVEYILGKDIEDTIKPFVNLLDYSITIKRK